MITNAVMAIVLTLPKTNSLLLIVEEHMGCSARKIAAIIILLSKNRSKETDYKEIHERRRLTGIKSRANKLELGVLNWLCLTIFDA